MLQNMLQILPEEFHGLGDGIGPASEERETEVKASSARTPRFCAALGTSPLPLFGAQAVVTLDHIKQPQPSGPRR